MHKFKDTGRVDMSKQLWFKRRFRIECIPLAKYETEIERKVLEIDLENIKATAGESREKIVSYQIIGKKGDLKILLLWERRIYE